MKIISAILNYIFVENKVRGCYFQACYSCQKHGQQGVFVVVKND
jgi:hypothetical protein